MKEILVCEKEENIKLEILSVRSEISELICSGREALLCKERKINKVKRYRVLGYREKELLFMKGKI